MTSPAGAPSGDAGQAQQSGEATQQQGPDIGALSQQMESYGQTLEGMREFLQSQPWAQPTEGAGEPEPAQENLDLSFLDEAGYDQQAATQLADVIEKQWQQREAALRAEMDQRHQQFENRLTEREQLEAMRDLVDEFPDMADPEVHTQIIDQARALVDARGWDPKMATDPRYWRDVYMQQQAAKAAQDEGREEPKTAHLEGGAGAASAGGQRGENDILQALSQSSDVPGWLRGR